MSDERKSTWTRTKYGNYHEWVIVLGFFALVIAIFLVITGLIMGVCAISDKYEVKAFNHIHGTNYTFGEWFWAGTTIKDYH